MIIRKGIGTLPASCYPDNWLTKVGIPTLTNACLTDSVVYGGISNPPEVPGATYNNPITYTNLPSDTNKNVYGDFYGSLSDNPFQSPVIPYSEGSLLNDPTNDPKTYYSNLFLLIGAGVFVLWLVKG